MGGELTADRIVELFERDARARRRLAELLVSEPDIRLAIVNAALREVATKSDLERSSSELRAEVEKLRSELRAEIEALRSEFRAEIKDIRDRLAGLSDRVAGLSERVSRLEGRVDLLIKAFLGFNVPLLVAVIGILIKLILG